MNQDVKIKIATAAAAYAKEKSLTNAEVSRLTGVNAGYISQIFRGIFTNTVADKETPIGETHFRKLASWAGIPLTKQYWKLEPTIQFRQMISILENAKANPQAHIIVNDTGMGKTQAVDTFCNKHPQHTYRLTVGDSYTLQDIINELLQLLGIDAPMDYYTTRSLHSRLVMINDKLADIRNSGGQPIIIFDEAENLRISPLKSLKEIYDASIDYCSIILIGTDQILENLQGKRNWRKIGIPQVFRRIKAGIRHILPLDKDRDFEAFFQTHDIDLGIRVLVKGMANNYGELHDYLEPALREADQRGEPLTEQLFRLRNSLPESVVKRRA